jgi:uncharacterized membrane protein HdeD (DUF308 family)
MKKMSGFGVFQLIIAVLMIVLGVLIFLFPGAILSDLVVLYAVGAVIIGIADVVLFIRAGKYLGVSAITSLVSGLISVMAGFSLLLYPGSERIVLTILFPIWFIAHSLSRIALLKQVSLVKKRGISVMCWLVNGIGILLGCVMLWNPFHSLLYVLWIAGVYLILLGVEGVIVAVNPVEPVEK